MRLAPWLLLAACGPKAPPTAAPTTAGDLPDTLTLAPGALDLGAPPQAPAADARAEEVLVPLGRWVRDGALVAYTYVDPQQGLSMQAEVPLGSLLAEPSALAVGADARTSMIVRLSWRSPDLVELTDEERAALGLPEVPDWIRHYGPQPPAGTLYGTWRLDPRLAGRFLPDYPDDLQVLLDDDPPSKKGFEVMWVRVLECEPRRCRARVLNEPFHLKSVDLDDEIWFSLEGVGPEHFLLREGATGPVVRRR